MAGMVAEGAPRTLAERTVPPDEAVSARPDGTGRPPLQIQNTHSHYMSPKRFTAGTARAPAG